ncbi:hypothetical protein GCM10022380_43150 [Amycolatopsis tucumanensis]|uniref:Uncharacterized protein n=1 Tax=Amycolatopsis tucumanensis TaxID=401106 RepID=A0ABP7IJ84_9PSEU
MAAAGAASGRAKRWLPPTARGGGQRVPAVAHGDRTQHVRAARGEGQRVVRASAMAAASGAVLPQAAVAVTGGSGGWQRWPSRVAVGVARCCRRQRWLWGGAAMAAAGGTGYGRRRVAARQIARELRRRGRQR